MMQELLVGKIIHHTLDFPLTQSQELPTATHDAFIAFVEDRSSFALLFNLKDGNRIEACAPIRQSHTSFQLELNELESNLDTSKPAYIVLRRGDSLTFITYVPYRAKEETRNTLLGRRHDVVQQLGGGYISCSIICKEIAEITDARSWAERDADATSPDTASTRCDDKGSCSCTEHAEKRMKDVGYKKNKCRLCYRRMKNRISPAALEALKLLQTQGVAVQIV
jgi:twinfilin-like protein